MLNIFTANRRFAEVLLVVLCSVCSIACRNDESALKADAAASTEVTRINKQLSARQKLVQKDIDSINEIYKKYPGATVVRQTLQAALVSREDWNSLEDLYKEIPAAELTEKDRKDLGTIYFKVGRYREAAETLQPLAGQGDPEIELQLAAAYYYLGEYDRAKPLLDSSWEQILAGKRAEEITLRGMIYFYQGEPDKAVETLYKALEIAPESISALNGLSRIYAARGNQEKAEEYLARVQQTFDKVTAEERRKTKFVANIYRLKEAYTAKRFEEVVQLAELLIPEADAVNKAALYQYLYNSYQALGRQKEAQDVLNRAKQTQQQ